MLPEVVATCLEHVETNADPAAHFLALESMSLNVIEMIFDPGAVTATVWSAPGHHGSICQNGCKSKPCGRKSAGHS